MVSVALYWSGLSGGLYFDDSHVLTENELIRLSAFSRDELYAAANSFLPGGRQLSMLTFALNIWFLGTELFYLKLVNLFIHIATGLAIYVLFRNLFAARGQRFWVAEKTRQHLLNAALIASILWLIAPINLSAVLYLSQRMTVLAYLFVTLGLITYLRIRTSSLNLQFRLFLMALTIGVFTFLAYKSKEVGILLPGYVLLIETVAFDDCRKFLVRCWREGPIQKTAVISILAAGLVGAFLFFLPAIEARLSGYAGREFTLYERVLTQFRAIGFYLSQILVPNNAELSMWHDDMPLSTGLLSPVTTLVSLLFLLVLFLMAVLAWSARPLITLCIGWFFLGHSLESTIFPLELMHEHRNYYGSMGVFLILCYLVLGTDRLGNILKIAVIAALIALNAGVLHARAKIWGDDARKATHEALHHPFSPFAQFNYATYLYRAAELGDSKAAVAAQGILERNIALDEQSVANEMLLILLSNHSRIEFDTKWTESAVRKLREYGYSAVNSRSLSGLIERMQREDIRLDQKKIAPIFDELSRSRNPRLITLAGVYLVQYGENPELSVPLFEKAAARSPGSAAFRFNLLRSQIRFGDFEKACDTLDVLLTMPESKTILIKDRLENAAELMLDKCELSGAKSPAS